MENENGKFTLELLVSNHAGVLNRITGLYSKRGYNIDSLVVHASRNPEFSSMKIVSCGGAGIRLQMVRQLRKLYDVKQVVLSNSTGTSGE